MPVGLGGRRIPVGDFASPDTDRYFYYMTERIASEDEAFRAQCRRQMARSLETRMKYGFCRVHRPILDTPGVRSFDSMKEYRDWCATHLPAYLGFQPAPAE